MVDVDSTAHLTARITRDGREDRVAVEEPLEIRVGGEPLSVTMRTPGHDEELALGFLYGEGLIHGPAPAGPTEDFASNVVEVDTSLRHRPDRRFYTTSSCGVCGKGALEEVAVQSPVIPEGPVVARRRSRGGPRPDAVRVRPARKCERLHRPRARRAVGSAAE